MISRRRFLLAAGLGALGARPAALAQPGGRIRRIGFVSGISRPSSMKDSIFGGFIQGMRELGYVEGKNLIIEWRFGEGKFERFDGFVKELSALNVEVIVVGNTPAAHAAKRVTSKIPIVLGATGDPVATGLVPSLARPGGNITGLSQNLADIAPKGLELLKTVLPKLARVAVLWNPGNESNVPIVKSFQSTAPLLAVQILSLEARSLADIDRALAALIRDRVDALAVVSDPLFLQHGRHIVDGALKLRLPSLVQQREYAELGALMSYGQSVRELFRRSAVYVDRLLKGAKPADLPIEQPSVFELVINLKTARALGLAIPNSVLLRTDRTIQ